MSSKMNQKSQIKRSKEKRGLDKIDKAMSDIKKIGIFSCCLIGLLVLIGVFVVPSVSYGAVVEKLPETFKSKMIPITDESDPDYERPPMPIDYAQYIQGVSTPKAFYGIDLTTNATISNIYCMDRKLIMKDGRTYQKDKSVIDASLSIKYPGLIYIIENGDTLPSDLLNTVSSSEQSYLIYYINQVIVWWYLDIVNGYSTGPMDVGRDVSYAGLATHQYENNLTVAEKTAILNDTKYGPYIREMITNAMNYVAGTIDPALNTIDTSSVTYTMSDEYIETSLIPVTSNASTNFINYTVKTNNENIKILNESGIEQTTFTPNERFKLRIPVSEVVDYSINFQVNISGNFRVHNAYFYVDSEEPSRYQRALLGQILTDNKSDSLSLNYEIPTGKVIISKIDVETGKGLAGAVLSITDKSGKEVYRYETTGADVSLTLPVGAYKITEVSVPDGYSVEVITKDFEVSSNNTTSLVIENTPDIPVPDTSSSIYWIYGVGTLIVLAGIGLIVVAKRTNNDKNK